MRLWICVSSFLRLYDIDVLKGGVLQLSFAEKITPHRENNVTDGLAACLRIGHGASTLNDEANHRIQRLDNLIGSIKPGLILFFKKLFL